MRIAQVAPLYESVPPARYGGTERVVAYLTDELVRRGHRVTLFASADSRTAAELVAPCESALRGNSRLSDPLVYHFLMLEEVRKRRACFDVIHFHVDYLHFPVSRQLGWPCLTTLHGRLDLPDLVPLYREYREARVVSISDAQRQPLPWLRWQGTVHHGLPEHLYRFHERPRGYLTFVGRVSPEKRLDLAIEIARRSGLPLRVAAKIDAVNESYHREVIRPLLRRSPHVEFLGEVGDAEKDELIGGAAAMLFPIDWPEPFGLVMIEAMACGTPTIAFRRGSVAEVIEHGVTGFVVDDVDTAVAAVGRVPAIDRKVCRDTFERRFAARVMADRYLALYAAALGAKRGRDHSTEGPVLRSGHVVAG